MGLGRLALAAVAHVWLTWGPPVTHAPAQKPTVAPSTVAPPTAAAPTPAPQIPDQERPGTGRQIVAPTIDSRSVWLKAPAVQVQTGVPAPASGKPHRYLYKSWLFWTIAGGLIAGTVAITYAVTRPPPMPYYGSVGNIPFP